MIIDNANDGDVVDDNNKPRERENGIIINVTIKQMRIQNQKIRGQRISNVKQKMEKQVIKNMVN